MARYFFDLYDGRTSADADGVELPDFESARIEAVRCLGEMLSDRTAQFWRDGEWRIEVKDYTGLILTTLIVVAVNAAAAPALR